MRLAAELAFTSDTCLRTCVLCGNCKKTNVLQDNPKGTAEGEWTCSACDSDFCKVCGKEKIDPARSWLTQVSVPDAVKK